MSKDNFYGRINDKGVFEQVEFVEVEKKSFEELSKGLKKLKDKYPDISRECFP